jgi:hypothetical protein
VQTWMGGVGWVGGEDQNLGRNGRDELIRFLQPPGTLGQQAEPWAGVCTSRAYPGGG